MKETITHPITGETLYRDVRKIELTYKEQKIIVNQPGWYPKNGNDDEGILSQEDFAATDYALYIMKERHRKYLEEQQTDIGNLSFA